MKKSKVFLITGTLVLAVSAIFATKATKKFATVTSAKTNQSGVNFVVQDPGGSLVPMTTAITGTQLEMNAAGITAAKLYTVTSGSHKVYLQ